jgi:hypothetical protein
MAHHPGVWGSRDMFIRHLVLFSDSISFFWSEINDFYNNTHIHGPEVIMACWMLVGRS